MLKITKSIIISLLFTFTLSCDNTSNVKTSNEQNVKTLTGYYERVGTIQYINNVAVDTISTNEGFRATKLFLDGFHIWIDNFKPQNQKAPWTSGQGIFGKYKIENDSLHEIVECGFGGRAGLEINGFNDEWSWTSRDTINKTVTWKAKIDLSEGEFIQFGSFVNQETPDTKFAEYWLKIPQVSKSELDGVYKRVGTIEYVNNVPVDTIPLNNDDFINYKFYHNGKFMLFNRNLTITDTEKSGFYGMGGYGDFEYENGILTERIDYGMHNMENFFKNLPNKDSEGVPFISFEVNLTENSFSQRWPGDMELGNQTSEYYIKVN